MWVVMAVGVTLQRAYAVCLQPRPKSPHLGVGPGIEQEADRESHAPSLAELGWTVEGFPIWYPRTRIEDSGTDSKALPLIPTARRMAI